MENRVVTIYRKTGNDKLTLGSCTVYGPNMIPLMSGVSLERGWLDNKPRISCIPAGKYPLILEWSPAFQMKLWEIYDVPNRSECKFHSANFWHQLNGCIALGRSTGDIDRDGYIDITASKSTMKAFHKAMEGVKKATLIIKESSDFKRTGGTII